MAKTELRDWFHVSSKNLGDEINLIPREPYGVRDCGEPLIPRICVAPTIAHCLGALRHRFGTRFYVYKTNKEAVLPFEEIYNQKEMESFYDSFKCEMKVVKGEFVAKVIDAHVTKECWFLDQTHFIKIGEISYEDSCELDRETPDFLPGDPSSLDCQQEAIDIISEMLDEKFFF